MENLARIQALLLFPQLVVMVAGVPQKLQTQLATDG
jgi:hypothetical protein